MEINGREVKAVHIKDTPITCVYIRQKTGDCPKTSYPDYACISNCGGNLAIVRYDGDCLISVFGLAFEELQTGNSIRISSLKDLTDIREKAKLKGYSLKTEEKQCSVLYRNRRQVAVFYPCYLAYADLSARLFLPEARRSILEVHEKIGDIFSTAEERGLDAFLEDPITGPAIESEDPATIAAISAFLGEEGLELLRNIRTSQKD